MVPGPSKHAWLLPWGSSGEGISDTIGSTELALCWGLTGEGEVFLIPDPWGSTD